MRKPYSILITDDDDGVRETLQSVVQMRGYRALIAEDGDEAMHIFRREYIDVCILDVNLPGLSGPETWQRFREIERRVLPCVFVTGDYASADRLRALEEPECDVVTKPLTKERVIASLESMIRKFVQASV